jgi:hypothetical protein
MANYCHNKLDLGDDPDGDLDGYDGRAEVPADPAVERFIREYLPLGPVQDGDLSACTEAERRCYEIGYGHGQAFTLTQVTDYPLWRRTVKQIMQRLWDNTVPFRHSLPMSDLCDRGATSPE